MLSYSATTHLMLQCSMVILKFEDNIHTMDYCGHIPLRGSDGISYGHTDKMETLLGIVDNVHADETRSAEYLYIVLQLQV